MGEGNLRAVLLIGALVVGCHAPVKDSQEVVYVLSIGDASVTADFPDASNTDAAPEAGKASVDTDSGAGHPTASVDTLTGESSEHADSVPSHQVSGETVETVQLTDVLDAGPSLSASTALTTGDSGESTSLTGATATEGLSVPASEPALLDYDRDGLADAIDSDDDDDGLSDQDEIASSSNPLDALSPVGHTSSHPGSVLSDPCVQAALSEYAQYRESHGIPPLPVNLQHTQLDLSGYYLGRNGDGSREVSNLDDGYGFDFQLEFAFKRLPGTDDVYQSWGVGAGFDGVRFFWFRTPRVFRSDGTSVTQFARQDGGLVLVQTMEHITDDGDFLITTELWITVSNSGLYPGGVCNMTGERWTANYWALQSRTSPRELTHMCTDDVNAYVPDMPGVPWQTESETCSCTHSVNDARLDKTCTPLPTSDMDAGLSAPPQQMRLE